MEESSQPDKLMSKKIEKAFLSITFWPYFFGAMKRGRGTCSTFQSFLLISANVPCTDYVHRHIYNHVWYVHVHSAC